MDDFISSVNPGPHDFIGQTLSFITIKIEVTFVHQARRACKERVINRENEYNAEKENSLLRTYYVCTKETIVVFTFFIGIIVNIVISN